MPRVIFINRTFWPDETATAQLLTDLAEALAKRGATVTVMASRAPRAASGLDSRPRGVALESIRSTRLDRGGIVGKALDLASFWLGALVRVANVVRPGDAVVVLTDPPLLGIAVTWVARRRGARCFHWVQDIYPEVAIAVSGRRELRGLIPLRNRSWRQAAGCVTLGAQMAQVIAQGGVPTDRIHLAPNWAPAGLGPATPAAIAALRAEWGLADAFVIAYSGNLGRVHDLDSVLNVAERLRPHPQFVFLFIGGGARAAPLAAEAARRGLTNVRFRPHQPRERLGAVLGAADLHLVTLRAGCETYVFPSKLYGAAAVGRPVLFIGPAGCDAGRAVVEGGWGLAFAPSDLAALAAAVEALRADPPARARLAQAALRFAAANGGVAAAAAAWAEFLFRGDCTAPGRNLPFPALADDSRA